MAIRLAVKRYAASPIGYCSSGGMSVRMSHGTLHSKCYDYIMHVLETIEIPDQIAHHWAGPRRLPPKAPSGCPTTATVDAVGVSATLLCGEKTTSAVPVLGDCLGHGEPAQALDASKAVEARVLHAAKRQRLAHVRRRKVVDRRHARLRRCVDSSLSCCEAGNKALARARAEAS